MKKKIVTFVSQKESHGGRKLREICDWSLSNSHQSKNKLVDIEEGEERNSLVVVGFSKEAARRSYGGWKLVVKKEEERKEKNDEEKRVEEEEKEKRGWKRKRVKVSRS